MRGRKRVCKKHIKQAGWSIAHEEQQQEGYHLELLGPRGERMKVDARSKPLAYRHAERQVLGTEPGKAIWAR
jgi:hypothetical protein